MNQLKILLSTDRVAKKVESFVILTFSNDKVVMLTIFRLRPLVLSLLHLSENIEHFVDARRVSSKFDDLLEGELLICVARL